MLMEEHQAFGMSTTIRSKLFNYNDDWFPTMRAAPSVTSANGTNYLYLTVMVKEILILGNVQRAVIYRFRCYS